MAKSILITVSLACGFVLGAGLDRYMMMGSAVQQPTEVRTGSISPPVRPQPAPVATAAVTPLQMREIVRDELTWALSTALPGTNQAGSVAESKPAAAPAPTLPIQQQQQALMAATDIIESGQWGLEERAKFHQQLAGLDPQLREQAMQKLVQAIDSGAIKSPNGGPPLL